MHISGLAVTLVAFGIAAGIHRLIKSVADTPRTPDPRGEEIEKLVQDSETPEVCPHCSTPQCSTAWFCPHCGRAVGPYNNLMPYIRVFSEGEVLRNGVLDRMKKNPLTILGYVLFSPAEYAFFAPVFWIFLVRNLSGKRESERSL